MEIDKNKCLSLQNEEELHCKIVSLIRKFMPELILVPGLGEYQKSDNYDVRLISWRKGYRKGQPDLIIQNPNKEFSGFCIEFKTPKGTGKLSEEQVDVLEDYAAIGYKTLVSND